VGLTGWAGGATLCADTGFGRQCHPDSQSGHTRPTVRLYFPLLKLAGFGPIQSNKRSIASKLLPVEPAAMEAV